MRERCDIWITTAAHRTLMEHLYPGDHDEHGAILHAGIVERGGQFRLLVREVLPAVAGADYVAGSYGYRALTPSFIHRNIVRCRDERLAYLAVHNHNSGNSVAFSKVDMDSHERGYPALLDIGRGVPVGALVYGRNAVEADIWLPDGRRLSLGEYRIIGDTIERRYANPRRAPAAAPQYDRQVRLLGAAGQAILGEAKVGVVGLGGIGSLVAEYLARLGVGELVLIDDDLIENTNLTRVVGATVDDVEARRAKVDIAERHVRESRPAIKIAAVAADIARLSTLDRLHDCDFVFLAADSMRARLVVNALAHQYYVPVTQLGAKITAGSQGALNDAMSAVRHIRPMSGCLWCNGWIDPTQLAIEQKTDEERKAQAYGVNEPNPSVITLNAVAAAHGVNDFLFDFLGLRDRERGYAFAHFHALSDRLQKVEPRKEGECPQCTRRLGLGDANPLPNIGA